MKKVVIAIVLFAICMALVVSTVIPISQQIKDTGQKSFNAVKNTNSNIRETP